MKQRVLSVALALCLLLSSQSMASAQQEVPLPQGDISLHQEGAVPQEDGLLPEAVALPVEDSAVQDDSLPAEDSATQDDDSSPVEDSAPQDDDSLPVEDSAAQEKDTLSQEILLPRDEVSAEESSSLQAAAADAVVPTPAQAYAAMIALKDQDAYKEGTPWTNYEPYSE